MIKISSSVVMIFILVSITFIGCGKNENEKFQQAATLQQTGKYPEAISVLTELKDSEVDTIAAKARLSIGKLYQMQITPQMVGNSLLDSALVAYGSCYTDYPKTKFAEEALFLSGFVNANDLQNFTKATELYNKFLESYPKSPYAEAVKQELEVMGLTPEEILNRKIAVK